MRNRFHQLISAGAIALGLVAAPPVRADIGTAFEDFESESATISHGWTGYRNAEWPNDYGYRTGTNVTGTASNGEAGGTGSYSLFHSYYGDTTLGGSFDLSEPFSFSVRFGYVNYGIPKIGFFDSTPSGEQSVVFGVGFDAYGGEEFSWGIVFLGADYYTQTGGHDFHVPWGEYSLTFSYDPSAGDHGRATASLFNASGALVGQQQLDFDANLRGQADAFDAFGLVGQRWSCCPDPGAPTVLNIDDATYSVKNAAPPDGDADGISDSVDNCPAVANADQTNTDLDGEGDACDSDDDNDGVADASDNCPFTANAGQADLDGDGLGNPCDLDPDGDGVRAGDNCPIVPNADQTDTDGDGDGDDCDLDDDGDGICDATAVLLTEGFDDYTSPHSGIQADTGLTVWAFGVVPGWTNGGDNSSHAVDRAPGAAVNYALQFNSGGPEGQWVANSVLLGAGLAANDAGVSYTVAFDAAGTTWADSWAANQTADDGVKVEIRRVDGSILAVHAHVPDPWSGLATAQDAFSTVTFSYTGDGSGPIRIFLSTKLPNTGRFGGAIDNLSVSVDDVCAGGPDNCPTVVNAGQADQDGDGIGDACEADTDGDGIDDDDDTCPLVADASNDDTDDDSLGDACDGDDDNDGASDGADNCPLIANASQSNADGDGDGDACDADIDGDGVANDSDNCGEVANSAQADFDGDGAGDACDADIDGDGVTNAGDSCASTPAGTVVNAGGCSIAQLCPCSGPQGNSAPWRNHGKYVSCTAGAANQFLSAGLITQAEKDATVSAAGQSSCGR